MLRSVPTHRELASSEFDVLLAGLEQVAGDLFSLIDDFADRLGDGRAADRGRARPISAETKGTARGVAMHDLDETARHPEHIADDLSKHRLMALAVIMRAGEDGDVAGGIDADIRTFEQAAAGAKLTRDARGCQTASLDIRDDADASQFPAACRFLPPGSEAQPPRDFQRLRQRAVVIA
jgi:hypothetical protein